MARKALLTLLFLALVVPASACAHTGQGNVVDVRIVSDHGGEFAKYRTYPQARHEGRYFFMEAVKGEKYSIELTIRSGRLIGVVNAVDGKTLSAAANPT